jgi:hypothetical protein
VDSIIARGEGAPLITSTATGLYRLRHYTLAFTL